MRHCIIAFIPPFSILNSYLRASFTISRDCLHSSMISSHFWLSMGSARYHIGAAARRDDRAGQVLPLRFLRVYAAGRHDLEHRERCAHGLDLRQTAGLLRREELEHLEAELERLMVVGRRGAARIDGDALLLTVGNELGIEAQRYDELRACGDGFRRSVRWW